MQFLSPLGWLALLSVPVLLGLWRLAATRRVTPLSSLIPFERLMARPPRTRSQLVTNILFWLQLAALIFIALTLARPVIWQSRARTVLVVLDTSASMSARAAKGGVVWDQTLRWLHGQLARKSLAEQWFIMTTAPIAALTPQPTAEPTALRAALASARRTHLSGSLSAAVRVGQALLGSAPHQVLVVTDEPSPETPPSLVRWQQFPAAVDNSGFVGLDAQGPLCTQEASHVLATVQNFGPEATAITVTASQRGRVLAEAQASLAPGAREALVLSLPADTQGPVELRLAPEDALSVDNRATLRVQPAAAWPLVLRSADPAFTQTLGRWLSACPTLTWGTTPPEPAGPFVLVTDQPQALAGTGALVFDRPASKASRPSHWLATGDHPIGAYLTTLGVVSAALQRVEEAGGTPVVWALEAGRRVPVVVARETPERRLVTYYVEPVGGQAVTPLVLAFFNGLRWVLGAQSAGALVGEPVVFEALTAGPLTVRRPDGTLDRLVSAERLPRYDATYWAGDYTATQGAREATVTAHFLNPVESNLSAPASTWQHLEPAAPTAAATRVQVPITGRLLLLVFGLLLLEWWAYCRRQRVRPS